MGTVHRMELFKYPLCTHTGLLRFWLLTYMVAMMLHITLYN
jgi:hypothetical protein